MVNVFLCAIFQIRSFASYSMSVGVIIAEIRCCIFVLMEYSIDEVKSLIWWPKFNYKRTKYETLKMADSIYLWSLDIHKISYLLRILRSSNTQIGFWIFFAKLRTASNKIQMNWESYLNHCLLFTCDGVCVKVNQIACNDSSLVINSRRLFVGTFKKYISDCTFNCHVASREYWKIVIKLTFLVQRQQKRL